MAAFDLFGSCVPVRVLCLEAGADRWADVPAAVLAHLQHAVARGKPLIRVPFADGRWHVFDFARMLRYDEAGPGVSTAAALAWYDEAGGAFFPPGKAHLQVQPSEAFTVDEHEAVCIVRRWTMDAAVVTGVEICVPGDTAMRIFRDKEREFGGNVKLGWYGASPADVNMAGKGLFRGANWNLIGTHRAHGRGLHFSPLRFPHLRYVVWAEHINVCIVPLCLVSFMKRPEKPVLGPLITCTLVSLDLKKFRREIKRFLPSSQLQDLDRYFDSDTENPYNFSKCVSDLIGLYMFAGAVLRTLEL